MQVGSTNPYGGLGGDANASMVSRIDSAFAALFEEKTPVQELEEITRDGMNGMWAWQLKEMKKRIADKIMSQMGVSRESIAALPDKERISIERMIMEEVERQVKEMVEQQMKKERGNALGLMPDLQAPAGNGSGSVDFTV